MKRLVLVMLICLPFISGCAVGATTAGYSVRAKSAEELTPLALDLSSNGKRWNKAKNNEKVALAEALSKTKGHSTTFWFNALNEYYDISQGTETLNDSIKDAIVWIEMGATFTGDR